METVNIKTALDGASIEKQPGVELASVYGNGTC
jgi:hypothetical protein